MNEKNKFGIWFPKKIEGEELQDFADWLNLWGDFDRHEECLDDVYVIFVEGETKNNHITEFGKGYQKAVTDVMEKLNLDFKQFDKRTKTGFKKES